MQTERSVAIGSFPDKEQAEQAIRDLQTAGFRDDQIRYSVNRGVTDILDGLSRMGVSPAEAEYYNQEFAAGHRIVVVLGGERLEEAAAILQRNGAALAHIIREHPNGHTLQVREETLQVHKQWVQAGEVRIRKRAVTENQTFVVPVTREEVIIERVPASGQPGTFATNTTDEVDNTDNVGVSSPAVEGNIVQLADGESMTILVRAEQVQFVKTPAYVEEVTITKKLVQEMRTITETLLKEQVTIEPQGNLRAINASSASNTGDQPATPAGETAEEQAPAETYQG